MAEIGLLDLIERLHGDLRTAAESAREVFTRDEDQRRRAWRERSDPDVVVESAPPVVDTPERPTEPDQVMSSAATAPDRCPKCDRVVSQGLVAWRGEMQCRDCANETIRSDFVVVPFEGSSAEVARECPICLERNSADFVIFRGHEMCPGCAGLLKDGGGVDEPSPVASAIHGSEEPGEEVAPDDRSFPSLETAAEQAAVPSSPNSGPQHDSPRTLPVSVGEEVGRWEILDLFDVPGGGNRRNAPVVFAGSDAFVFVDLYSKYGRNRNKFVSDTEFLWIATGGMSKGSDEARALADHRQEGRHVHLLVRRRRKNSAEKRQYFYLGEVEFVGWREGQHLEGVWELPLPVPQELRLRLR